MMALVSLPGLNESEIKGNMISLASFPGLPGFLFVRFALTIVHRRLKSVQKKQGRPGSIHHLNDIRWTQGGRKSVQYILDQFIIHLARLECSTVKSGLSLTYLQLGPPTLHSPNVTHMVHAPRPSSFLAAPPLICTIVSR